MSASVYFKNWKKLLGNPGYLSSLIFGVICLVFSYFFYQVVIRYVDSFRNLPPLGDFIHDLLPIADMRFVYIYGLILAVFTLIVYIIIWRPHLLPFFLKLIAFVYITRSFFIMLTHLGPPAGFFLPMVAGDFQGLPIDDLLHTNDLFFSGHVAYPFMAALLVRKENRFLYYMFLAISVLMGFTVLIMRVHYSIDVFAAFFIVYGVYSATYYFFGKKDYSFKELITR
jgi:membrane-associated phospholipid phosphatase